MDHSVSKQTSASQEKKDPTQIRSEILHRWNDEGNIKELCPCIDAVFSSSIMENIIDGDELIIGDELIWIDFSYPLDRSVRIEYQNQGGFSRRILLQCIASGYKAIYDAEEAAVGPAGTVSEMCMNRACTHGPFGIRFHEMGNLYLEGLTYYPDWNILFLNIGS